MDGTYFEVQQMTTGDWKRAGHYFSGKGGREQALEHLQSLKDRFPEMKLRCVELKAKVIG